MWARFSLGGIARKVALSTIILSAIGYFIFVIGWGKFLSSYISAGGYILYIIGTAVSQFQDVNVNAIFAGMIITQLFSMVTGAVLGFIDVKRGKDMEATYRVIP
eukprot:Em0013g869a